jgi:hypothetical protein
MKVKSISVDGPCWEETIGLKLTYANGQTFNFPNNKKRGLIVKTAMNKMKVNLGSVTWPSGTVTHVIDDKEPQY